MEEVTSSSAELGHTQGERKKKKRNNKKKNKFKAFMVETAFPWKVLELDKKGKCAVATRAIKAGETVVAEHAVAFSARGKYRNALCHFCGIDLAFDAPKKECSVCRFAVFCEKCHTSCEELHDQCCQVYREIEDIAKEQNCDSDLLRLIFNLALKKPSSACKSASETVVKDGVLFPSFLETTNLKTHVEKAPPEWVNAIANGCKKLHAVAASVLKDMSVTTEDLEHFAAMVNTNAHGMGAQGLHNTDVALGIFPFVSKLNHSCRPNCCFASNGDVMYVRAVQDIAKGSELCVSYINLYEPRSLRKHQLVATKHFDCLCDRCTEPLNQSVDRFLEGCVCHYKGCGGVVVWSSALREGESLSPSWECDSCSHVFEPPKREGASQSTKYTTERPWELVAAAEKRLLEAIQVYSERQHKQARKMLESYLVEFTGKLHQLHVLLFDALTPLMNCCRALGDAEEGLRVCRLIVQCMEKVLPGPSLEIANFYFCLGEMYTERAHGYHVSPAIAKRSSKLAQEAFERVKSIRQICLGTSSLP